VEKAARKSQIMPVTRNELYSGIEEGRYRDVRETAWYCTPAQPLQPEPGVARKDNRTGMMPSYAPDENTPYTLIEQHCRMDLDGDGYAEPWIITIETASRCVVRIVAGWDDEKQVERSIYGRLSRIHSTEYYTKYGFIPSPDGGIYDLGFGVLLGPLNSAVNSILNQLIDAGTLATTSGGFLARGAKIRGGQYQFNQFGWNRVDSTGDDLKKSIFPMPVREPSEVLFKLLGFIVQYASRLGASTDALVGENPGQNTPAQTQQSMVEQGMKLYSALFKRMWRSMKEEFHKLYLLNATYLPEQSSFGPDGAAILREDYLGDPRHIAPVADPNVVSDQQLLQRALTIKQAAAGTPGYDLQAVERKFLRALKVDDVDSLYPGPDKTPPLPNPKLVIEQAKSQGRVQEAQEKGKLEMQKFMAQLSETHRLNDAKILQLRAQAANLMEQAGGVQTGHEIAIFNAAIAAYKTHNESIKNQMDSLTKAMELRHDIQSNEPVALGGGVAGLGAASGNAGGQGGAGEVAGGAQGGMG
jgi:chaperonin GroES